ncbi:MAG: protein-glutamate O-methyltransferase CheR [Prolixibacteraceae bacterium]|nr:protein-glutamate O-methyltransferase CheR [Prolixibacteraceae bacterium]
MKSELIQISDELFLKLGRMITEKYGIKMSAEKKIMFQARLQRRLRELDIKSFDEYARRLFTTEHDSVEISILADYISTNKTDFFREKEHFQFITDHVLPEIFCEKQTNSFFQLKLWSAGCSSGQEAYSMAITLEEFMQSRNFRFDYSIVATDISGRMLKTARQAVYPMSQVEEIPLEIKKRYFLKSKSLIDKKVRIVKNLRDRVKPAYLNLMDNVYVLDTQFDLIFLRNTLIYFEHQIQQQVLTKILDKLKIGGYLFIGHSESLINMNLPIRSIAPSVYVKINT